MSESLYMIAAVSSADIPQALHGLQVAVEVLTAQGYKPIGGVTLTWASAEQVFATQVVWKEPPILVSIN